MWCILAQINYNLHQEGESMQIPISARLLACAGFVPKGSRVADIGCDHGYLGIHLLQQGIASRVIASDINQGPLDSARRNGVKYGVGEKMSFHLSDGAKAIPRDFDVMVCAGMGGDTMISILEDASWLKSEQYTLILQCQSKTPKLRSYLTENGWCIGEESVLRDGRFLYTVMKVRYQPDAPRLSLGQQYFSPALLRDPSPEAAEYFQWVVGGLKLATAHQDDPEKAQALQELEQMKW